MAESLFDNRYRYDYIYPRGRSGETLRAVDSQANDRPVVIKRPAPNDAPPIRAGQEVSINAERRALMRLAGHPALTELVGEGQFAVGGVTHQYIVVERANGVIIADEVLTLAAHGERLPELETLVVVDRLLDLLNYAHSRDIVYNDVDAKHLFWDRSTYRLKVIDWGNAVFLEGEEITPQGISRQSDIFQVGELLYFIVTGGRRAEVPRDAAADFVLDVGDDAERVSSRLPMVISKALHPNPKLRYGYVNELRRDLAEVRVPLERERDSLIARVAERLRRNLSKGELVNLQAMLDSARAFDPGYPAITQTQAEIDQRLQGLAVDAGLDVARIYLESANWSKAAEVLRELREQSSAGTATRVNLLLDAAMLMLDAPSKQSANPSPAIQDALGLMFEGYTARAANVLLTADTADGDQRRLQWLLAERISSHAGDVLLLHPNLYRLELALAALTNEGYTVQEPRAMLRETRDALEQLTRAQNVAVLRDGYRDVVDRLTALNTVLSTFAVQHNVNNRKLPISSLERALNAVMALADNMHVIGRQATGSPRDAMGALDSARAIDPTNPVWDSIAMFLNNLYNVLQSYQTYVPVADGSDLEEWLTSAHQTLSPYARGLFDELLNAMTDGLNTASTRWKDYAAAALRGDRARASSALHEASQAVSIISPTLSGWLNQLRLVVDGSRYVERHALFGGLGRALADGWAAYDHSRLADAERLAQQAYEIARTAEEQAAADRLRQLSRLARDWVERGTATNETRTQAALNSVEALFSDAERKILFSFNAQMPSPETYLKAMGKGILELYHRNSTAAARILALHYVMYGALDVHAERLDGVAFWREAAVRALGEDSANHVTVRTLDELAARRRDLLAAAALVDSVRQPAALENLERIRRQIEDNPQGKTLAPAVMSLREFEAAVRDWAEGEFRSAGLKIENALKALQEVQQAAIITMPNYEAWLALLQANAAELHVQMRVLRGEVDKRSETPAPALRLAHRKLAETTQTLLGERVALNLTQWRDTYERFLAVYADNTMRRSRKLEQLNDLFRQMFIDRHPAYSLYRYWYEVVDNAPEFPPPPTDDPMPHIDESAERDAPPLLDVGEDEPQTVTRTREDSRERGARRRWWIFGLLGLMLGGGALVIALMNGNNAPDPLVSIALTITDTPDATLTPTPETDSATLATATQPIAVSSATLESFATATLRPTDSADVVVGADTPRAVPSDTPAPSPTFTASATPPPTETHTPTATFTPSLTFTPTATFTPTLPSEGLSGTFDLLEVLPRFESSDITWNAEYFSLGVDGTYWRLGTGGTADVSEIQIAMPPQTLEKYFGNQAASRLRRVEATISLLTSDPLLPQEDVYFGLMLVTPDDTAGVQNRGVMLQALSLTSLNLFQRVDGESVFVSQQAVNAVLGRLRIDRDIATGVVTTFLNDVPIGSSVQLPRADAPLTPILFIHGGGVVASVTNWRVTLR